MAFLPIDIIVDQKTKQKHLIETLNLLAFVGLLVLVLITTWYFKRRKRLYIHETGLAIIYGMVMGIILRYFGLEVDISSHNMTESVPSVAPHDYIIVASKVLADKGPNITHFYAYEFRGELPAGAKLGSQISYASVNPEVFFNIILPPIILNAGLSLKRRHFFRNIGAIFSYAFLGTTISVAFVGFFLYAAIHALDVLLGYSYLVERFSLANCLYFGAIISPTDPLAVLAIFQELGVDVNLFALIFGESILNDAVSIVLTHSIDHFTLIHTRQPDFPILMIVWQSATNFVRMFLSSCAIGVLFGVVTALTTKFSKLTDSPLLETSLVVLMSYSSFLSAEVIDASGIVAILLCGITQAHYTINNLSFEAREWLKDLFEILNFLCENFLFIAVGIALWQRNQTWNLPFVGLAFVAVFIARALSIYPLTLILNLGRRNKIPCNFQHIITWGGAARGVISYSLAAKNTVGDARRIMLSTTSGIVVFTVIAVGAIIEPMVKCLNIPLRKPTPHLDEEDSMKQQTGERQHLITGLNPHWLVRRRRLPPRPPLSISDSSAPNTPNVSSKFHLSAANNNNNTPIYEVDSVWTINNHRAQHQLPEPRVAEPSQANQAQELSVVPEGGLACQTSGEPTNAVVTLYDSDRHQQPVLNSTGSLAEELNVCQHSAVTHRDPYDNAGLVRWWRRIDNSFIKPLLTNSQPSLMETLPGSLRGLAKFLTSEEQFRG